VTELVGAEQVIANSLIARRRAYLAPDDHPTAIQIYGHDPALLLAAARIAAAPSRRRGSQLRMLGTEDLSRAALVRMVARSDAMVAMAAQIVAAVDLPVTIKTRIGGGRSRTCRSWTSRAGSRMSASPRSRSIAAPPRWASWRCGLELGSARERGREHPVIVNGDVRTADDVVRALAETGCAGVMIGRRAIAYPWVFREARARLAGVAIAPPTEDERRSVYGALVEANVRARGERAGVASAKRYSASSGRSSARGSCAHTRCRGARRANERSEDAISSVVLGRARCGVRDIGRARCTR